ncbi:MAG: reverse transcriptase family protein [Ruminococcus sp.]|nr:reverse transcriptase family protein [Ruminococcus sp.]
MWKYFTKEHNKEFILSLDLIKGNMSDNKKLNILYAIANNPNKYYTKKYILKKDGTKRELLVPNNYLKNIQRNILNNILNGLTVSKYVTSYLPNKSLKDNALVHVNKKIVLKMDIKDFFNSITFENLYNALPSEIFPPSVKVLLIKLCTYDDYLPQGAPTSPMLSNLVLKSFDNYIGLYCSNLNISYTRYSDDLTFSGDFDVRSLINKVTLFLENMGFNISKKKTRVIRNNKRQIVTGIVVNEKANVAVNYRKTIRQEMYYINKYGLESHLNYHKIDNKLKYLSSLKGRINYCLQISNDREMKRYIEILNNLM